MANSSLALFLIISFIKRSWSPHLWTSTSSLTSWVSSCSFLSVQTQAAGICPLKSSTGLILQRATGYCLGLKAFLNFSEHLSIWHFNLREAIRYINPYLVLGWQSHFSIRVYVCQMGIKRDFLMWGLNERKSIMYLAHDLAPNRPAIINIAIILHGNLYCPVRLLVSWGKGLCPILFLCF